MENRNDKGQLQKGHGGLRKKGTQNKVTVEIKQRIERVLEILEESIETDIQELSPKDKILLWKDLQEFVRPRLQRTQTDLTTKGNEITKVTFEVLHGNQPEN